MNALPRIARDPRDGGFRSAPSRHKSALAAIQFGLSDLRAGADPTPLVDDAATVLRHLLGPTERGWMLMAAAQAAEPRDLAALALAAVEDTPRGAPIPAFGGMREEAKLWAADARPAELRAHLSAAWNQLSEIDKAGFLRAVGRGVSA